MTYASPISPVAKSIHLIDSDGYYAATNLEDLAKEIYEALTTGAPAWNVLDSIVTLDLLGAPTYTSLRDFIKTTLSAGRTSGGVISDATGGAVNVTAGTGFIKTTDSGIGVTKSFDWPLKEDLALVDNDTNYIYVDYALGTPEVKATTDRTTIDGHTEFTLGRVYRAGTTLHIVNSGTNLVDSVHRNHERLILVRRFERASGGVISETGTRNIASSAGVFFLGANREDTAAQDTSGVDTFTYAYRDGIGGWTQVAAQSQINNLQYDDGDGTLGNLTPNRYGVHWVFIHFDGDLFVVYGQGDYKLADAENAIVPTGLPEVISEFSVLAAKIIIQQNAASFSSVVSGYETLFPVSSPADHNDLGVIQGGVADEYYHLTLSEHTELSQWLDDVTLVDGGAISGITTLGMTGQLTNTLAIGTPPFVITSTTVVPNLNVDMVDGYHLDQDVLQASSPTFVGLVLSGAIATPTTITTSGIVTVGSNIISKSVNSLTRDTTGSRLGLYSTTVWNDGAAMALYDDATGLVVWYDGVSIFTVTSAGNATIAGDLVVSGDNIALVNAHSRTKIRLQAMTNDAYCLGTESYIMTYGPEAAYGNTIIHKFYTYQNEVALRIGNAGGLGAVANRLNVYVAGDLIAAGLSITGAMTLDGAITGVNSIACDLGTSINEFSTDTTLAGDSDDAVPTEKAIKAYVATQIATVNSLAEILVFGNEADGTNILLDQGADLIVYSDDKVTEVARIDGATGNITTIGTVDGVDVAALKTDVDGFQDELKDLTQVEIQQLENIDATTISIAQWGYLGALDQGLTQASSPTFVGLTLSADLVTTSTIDGVDVAGLKTDVDGFPDDLKNLAATEIAELENIGATTISVGQWVYLGGLDQALAQASSPTFVGLTLSGAISGTTTISAGGTFFQVDASGNIILSIANATAVLTIQDSATIELKGKYWTGLATADVAMLVGTDVTTTTPEYEFFIKREDLTKVFSVDEAGNGMVLGDFTVANLITAGNVDGVDVSTFKTAYDTHVAAGDIHVAHSGVTITAGTGLSGGGTIAASRTINCDITQYTDGLARTACLEDDVYGVGWDADVTHAPTQNAVYDKINAMDTLIAANTTQAEVEAIIDAEIVDGQSIDNAIDALISTHNVANRHIDHSTVSVIAGTGLSGGGTIAASRTINCDITQYTNAMAVAAVQAANPLALTNALTVGGNLLVSGTTSSTISHGDLTYGLGTAITLYLGTDDTKCGAIRLYGNTAGGGGLIQATTNNLHIDALGGNIYLGHYDNSIVYFSGTAYYVDASGNAKFNGLTLSGAISGATTISAGGTYFQVGASGDVLLSVISADASNPYRDSPTIELKGKYWTGSGTADIAMLLGTDVTGGIPRYKFFIKREDLTTVFSVDESGHGAVLGNFTAANIVTAGNVDGVDISATLDQAVLIASNPTFAGLDLTPSSTGTQTVIGITPSQPLVQGSAWIGADMNLNALDPATGNPSSIIGLRVIAVNVHSADNDAAIYGFYFMPSGTESSYMLYHSLVEMTAVKTQRILYSYSVAALSSDATYQGIYLDWDGITRDGGIPGLQGIRSNLPASYAGFGTSYAGYFSGDGRYVYLCDTTYALKVSGAMLLGGAITGVDSMVISGDLTAANIVTAGNVDGVDVSAHAADGDIHIAHSGVTITAGTGLSGGGTIAASWTINCDITQYTDVMVENVITAELVNGQSIDNAIDSLISTHNVANRHIDHSGVSITAGTGLSGGGTIAATRTINCDITQYTDALARTACVSDVAYGAGWNGVTTIAPSKNAVYDKIETLGGANYDADLNIGSGNADWINCPYEGASNEETDEMTYHGRVCPSVIIAGNRFIFSVPLPTTRGGKSLYINGTRVSLADADGNDRVANTRIYGMGNTTATELDNDLTDKNAIGLWEDLSMGALNLGGYDVAKIVLTTYTNALGDLEIQYVTVRYYYA